MPSLALICITKFNAFFSILVPMFGFMHDINLHFLHQERSEHISDIHQCGFVLRG